MAKSKIIFGSEVLMDLTADTVKANNLLKGYTAHGADGEPIVGACEYDADTQDATAADAEILLGKTAYIKGAKVTGKMPDNGSVSGTISTKDEQYTIAHGFHDGGGKIGIAAAEKAKLIASNIRQGVTILGIEGNMSGAEGIKAQSKTVTPTLSGFEVLPDSGYTHLTQVTVAPIPYKESDNAAGGKTVVIG